MKADAAALLEDTEAVEHVELTDEVGAIEEIETIEKGLAVEEGTFDIGAPTDPAAGQTVRIAIPVFGFDPSPAVIYVRYGEPPIDSNNPPAWESFGFWRGEDVFRGENYGNRLFAIEDAARTIADHAAGSRKRKEKAAAPVIMKWLESMDTMGDDGPAGEPCDWPTIDSPSSEVTDGEQIGVKEDDPTPAPDGLAGEEGSGGGAKSDAPDENPNDHFTVRFQESMAELATATLDYVDCKARYKYADARFKKAIEGLKAVADKGMERLPLFDRQPAVNDTHTTPQAPAGGGTTAIGVCDSYTVGRTVDSLANPAPDAWRSAPVEELGLTKALTQRLVDTNVSTMGQLVDVHGRKPHGIRGLDGIGPAKAEKIEEALLLWLDTNGPVEGEETDGEGTEGGNPV